MKWWLSFFLLVSCSLALLGEGPNKVYPGADEKTPSKAMYFDWINSEWPGSNEQKVLANLEFFQWLHETYGMQLDIYHLDAGNLDQSQFFMEAGNATEAERARLAYGRLDSERFRSKFPNGLKPIFEKAGQVGCGMGIWMGPDGYGDTPEEAGLRRKLLVSLVRDYGFRLFKFDAAATDLRENKQDEFIRTMTECRLIAPDLIALNHRIRLNDEARRHMTTFLWEGRETYIDVHMANGQTAPHHRVEALSRGLTPGLKRLAEDHGVCLSSCLDYWEDDLILQAFNRSLILAPEIYGNPWLLSDLEFARLARIYNLHRQYRDILVNGMELPESSYGPKAVSRGDGETRLVTLRNLTWLPVKRKVRLDQSIGLTSRDRIEVRQYHPTERVLGAYSYGDEVEVEVLPFRSCLLLASTQPGKTFSLSGCAYEVIQDLPGKPLVVRVLGMPGEKATLQLQSGVQSFYKAMLDQQNIPGLIEGKPVKMTFPGNPFKKGYHYKIAELEAAPVPSDAEALYEATCFAADNNALEARSLKRSGPTKIPQVQKARDAFFQDQGFVNKGVWDRFAWDGRTDTFFKVRDYVQKAVQVKPGAFRLDLGAPRPVDRIVLEGIEENYSPGKAEVSLDLIQWRLVRAGHKGNSTLEIPSGSEPFRYLRLEYTPLQVAEIEALNKNQRLPRAGWRASNLFRLYKNDPAQRSWTKSFELSEIPRNGVLAVALPGKYGNEAVSVALRVEGRVVGAPDRAPSFECNHWEHVVARVDGNYTYYFPLSKEMAGKEIKVVVLGFKSDMASLKPEVWMTTYPIPYEEKILRLSRK